MSWAAEHWEALTATLAVVLPTVVQIAPIKFNPWTRLASALGRAINREILTEVKEMHQSLEQHIAQDDQRDADRKRMRVLRFNDELIHGVRHTQEHFNEILDDITAYERYCENHPNYQNNKAVMAIENVKRTYQRCEDERNFL